MWHHWLILEGGTRVPVLVLKPAGMTIMTDDWVGTADFMRRVWTPHDAVREAHDALQAR